MLHTFIAHSSVVGTFANCTVTYRSKSTSRKPRGDVPSKMFDELVGLISHLVCQSPSILSVEMIAVQLLLVGFNALSKFPFSVKLVGFKYEPGIPFIGKSPSFSL